MANDKSIELRVSLLEYQMETLVEMVKKYAITMSRRRP